MAYTLQNVLDRASYLLGESGTPSSEITKRTDFANSAKGGLRYERDWSWEIKDGDAISFTYSAPSTTGGSTYTYSLNPSAGTLKNRNSIIFLQFKDQNGAISYFKPVSESEMNYQTANSLNDNVFFIKGNDSDGYTLVVNAYAAALPTVNVSNAWSYRYFFKEADFSALTDTTTVPKMSVLAWKVAALVLYGYREQAQFQLAEQKYQSALAELAESDQKHAPYQSQRILSFRESVGFSNNFKTYY